jgi:hypothetical protein
LGWGRTKSSKEIKRRQTCEEQAKDKELENKKVDMNEPKLLKKMRLVKMHEAKP